MMRLVKCSLSFLFFFLFSIIIFNLWILDSKNSAKSYNEFESSNLIKNNFNQTKIFKLNSSTIKHRRSVPNDEILINKPIFTTHKRFNQQTEFNLDNEEQNKININEENEMFSDSEEDNDDEQLSGSGDDETEEPNIVRSSTQSSIINKKQNNFKNNLFQNTNNFVFTSSKQDLKVIQIHNCLDTEFKCSDGSNCLEISKKCNGFKDCNDGSDELNCDAQCGLNMFKCSPNHCIPISKRCDNEIDCETGKDEIDCVSVCNPTFEFQCKNTQKCVNIRQVCDGQNDCLDGSDEINCKCKKNEFQCENKRHCIKNELKCNGNWDCIDGSDEANCSCALNEFRCNNGQCIPLNKRCNSIINCQDQSDEIDCEVKKNCKLNEFECSATKRCIDIEKRCDSYFDCEDYSDELNCDKEKCKNDEFTCRNKKCIAKIFVCDKISDCTDGSDEDFCWKSPIKKNFDENKLKFLSKFSNSKDLKVYPNYQTVKVGFTAVLRCRDESINRLPITWYKVLNKNLIDLNLDYFNDLKIIELKKSNNIEIRGGRLTLKIVDLNDQGFYLCKTIYSSIPSYLSVEQDEKNFLSSNDFMLNDAPEISSNEASSSSLCGYNEFACGNSNQCIPRSFLCDNHNDCLDNSDEIGCSPPMIVQTTEKQVIVSEGENTTMYCKAIGTPTPVITWKYNWKDINNSDRFITSSKNGLGLLQITKAQQNDNGRYICTARNNLDTTTAPFDFELIIKSKSGVCLPPTFYDDAKTQDQCIKCFCFNLTSTCYSSNLKIQSIPLNSRLSYVFLVFDSIRNEYRELPSYLYNQNKLIFNKGNEQSILNSSILDSNTNNPETVIYWSLPNLFTGNLIKSYGGFIRYYFHYIVPYHNNKIKEADIIIKNEHNNLVAYHNYDLDHSPLVDNQIQLRLTENHFTKERSSDRISQHVFNREEFLTLLQNVTHFYIRAKFDQSFIESKILSIEIDSAVEDLIDNNNNQKIAKLVEKCSCPTGYQGTSCESCAPGYNRRTSFHYGSGSCIKEATNCRCNENSYQCDSLNRCYNCQNNTEGYNCEKCKRSFYGDPTKGIPCRKCDCPDLSTDNSSSGHCILENDGLPSCVTCPLGTEGRRCEFCAPNYIRDSDGKCRILQQACTNNTEGYKCERCVKGYFGYPSRGMPCQKCECQKTSSEIYKRMCIIDGKEINCKADCADNEFKCKNGNCIPISSYCDGYLDCADETDENNCPSSPCNPIGSYTSYYKTRNNKCDCKPFVTGDKCDKCEINSFNFNDQGCTKCYCLGVSNNCEAKDVTRYRLNLNPNLKNLNLTTIDNINIEEEDGSLELKELDTENSVPFIIYKQNPIKKKPTTIFYWRLPKEFLGNKIGSYGSKMSYKIIYKHLNDEEEISYNPDLILASNHEELHFKQKKKIESEKLTKIEVVINENSFLDARGQPIRKNQLMNVLQNLDKILIKASYTRDIIFTGIKEIKFEIDQETKNELENKLNEYLLIDQSIQTQIESCKCPTGYTGNSCEKCSEGFYKKPGYYHQCIPCDCNGNSNKCDALTGKCIDCQYNTEGDNCEKCQSGFLFSRTRGFIECIESIENKSSSEAYNNCNCKIDGVFNLNCDSLDSRCYCKDNVEGSSCDRCKAGFYNLNKNNVYGCTECSCSGVTKKCRENYSYLTLLQTDNKETDLYSLRLQDKDDRLNFAQEIEYNSKNNEFSFSQFDLVKDKTLYWHLPRKFLGNKLKAYGYKLSYEINFSPVEGILIADPDVVIKGKNLTIIYTAELTSSQNKNFEIPLEEKYWEKIDMNKKITKLKKDEFLKVLQYIKDISIRAVYREDQKMTSIKNLALEITTETPKNKNDKKVITNIEQCLCPIGYEGSSCETCSFGYARSKNGLCLKCDCNGHSNNCYFTDDNEQICSDCLHDTKGKQCEQCATGFYGDARLKTPNACKPCMCPSIKPMNNYADSCSQEMNGQIICNNCQEGYSGNNCEKCSLGYEKINNTEGFRCLPQLNFYRNKTLDQRMRNHQNTQDSQVYKDTIVSSSTTRLRLDPNHLSQIVPSGQTASLRCVAQSLSKNELLPIEWFKEKDSLPQNSRQYQGILEISNVRVEDSGTYVCVVKDIGGSTLKLNAHLQVENQKQNEFYSNEQKSRVEPRVLNVEIGEQVMLNCVVQSSKSFEVKWFKTSQSNELIPENRVINNALVINEASLSDSGDYYCQVKTNTNQQMVRSRLIVTKKNAHVPEVSDPYLNTRNMNQPLDVIVVPTVHIIPEKQTLVQGKDGQLKCIATGNPKPTITWIKAHSQLSPRHIIKNIDSSSNSITSVLEILDSVVEDRGLYVCRAESSGGMVQQSAIVEIERREIPAIEIYPSSVQSLQVDSSALFQCRITAGIPSPTIEWRKSDGKIINPSNEEGIEVLSGGVIRFNSLKTDQQGKYICSAYNSAGRVNAEAELNVVGSIQVRIRQTSPYRIREGDRVKLDCELIGQSNGFPQYRLEWRKIVHNSQNNYAQLQIPYISAEPNTASLIINQVGSDDSGSYLCLGFSAQSNEVLVQERIQLIVEKPETHSSSSSHHTLQVEDRVIRAQIDAPVQIRCFVRKISENIKLNWLKLDSNLPVNSRVEDGVLYIEKVLPEDDGTYVCTGYNEKTKTVAYTEKIRLAVVGFYGKGSPKIALMPLMQSAKAGDQIKVQCQVLSEDNSRVHWTKLIGNNRQPIKVIGNQDAMLSVRNHFQQERVKQINDTLVIDNANYDDQGNYLCTVISAGGTAEAVAEILVTEQDKSMRTLIASRTQNVITGQTTTLKCPLKHDYPIIKWTADQKQLPENAIANFYDLTITDVTSQNEGRYICAAYDDKNSMVDRDYVVLTVKDLAQDCSIYEFKCNDGTCIPKSARCNSKYDCSDLSDENNCGTFDRENNLRITNNNEDVEIGGTLILECTGLKNSQQKPVKWLKMNGNESTDEFLDNVIIEGNKLKIQSIRVENGGIYRCLIDEYPRNVFTDNVVTVKVQAKSAPFGTNIIMHCKSNAIVNVQNYHWKKQNSPLPENALARGSVLTIRNLNENNADIYTCIARNSTHRVEIPTILRVTNIIPLFNSESFIGIKTSNLSFKKNEIEFSIKFKTLNDSLILFRSKNSFQSLNDPNFLISKNDNAQNDFIALIINKKHLEAKFELGNGVVTLKSHSKLKVDVWHHIKFKKHYTRALLEIDDQPEVEHISNGQSVGLNLDNFWYVGGFPDFTILKFLSKNHLKIDSGIHGCISFIKLDNKNYNLIKSLKYSKNILSCDTCNIREQQIEIFQKLIDLQQKNQRIFKNFYTTSNGIHQLNEQLFNLSSLVNLPNSTCRNNGICQEALTNKGMKCICNSGFTGQFCEKNSEQCFPGYCGLGKCVDLKKVKQNRLYNGKNHLSYICDCPLGKTGDRCTSNITITQPRFTGERSFISYPIFKESSSQISITIKLRLTVYQPNNLIRDALIWYSAEKSNGNGDFISLIIKNQKFVFLFNTGSGITKIESQPLLNLTSKWVMIKVSRLGGEGRLLISLNGEFNDIERTDIEYVGYSPGNTKGINLRLPLYIGDIDEQLVTLPSVLKDINGFIGCVNKIIINNYTLDITNHLIDSSNIKECGSRSSCFNKPCQNNGVCSENVDSKNNINYKCFCRQPFSGINCEINNGICAKSKPCQNKGKCIDASTNVYFNGSSEFLKTNKNSGYRCCCQIGYTGSTCEIIEEIKDPHCAYFETNSYFVINKKIFSQNSSETEQVIELTFETQSFNGLIFYQGDMNFLNKDYLMMSLVDGFLEITWQLGSGPGFIKSEESLNDGRSHQIIFKRKGQEGQLIVDILNPIFGKSGKGLTQLNVDNDIYIGGLKNIEFLNKNTPSIVGFSGTISNIKIDNSINISFNKNLRSSCNIRPCSSKIF